MQQLIQALIGWLRRPWQGVFLVIFVPVVALSVFLVYERAFLEQVLLERFAEPALDRDQVEAVADQLLVSADLVAVYQIELVDNTQKGFYATTAEGEVRALQALSVPFIPDTGGRATIALQELTGAIVCFDIREEERATYSAHTLWYLDNGYIYVCARKIPLASNTIVGIAHLVWAERPTRPLEFSARVSMNSLLDDMVSW